MRGVIFDIRGTFAHFRKIYTNSSSLSYSVPPRTTIAGLLAAMFGYERGSYYEKWSSDYVHIAVRKLSQTYTITQTLNYIKAVSTGELANPKEHTQIPMEVITGADGVAYRIYVCFDDEQYTEELSRRLKNNQFVYPPSLGTAFFLADIDYVADADFVKSVSNDNDFVSIATVIGVDLVSRLNFEQFTILKEKMPRDFKTGRVLQPACSYFVEASGRAVSVKLQPSACYWEVGYQQQTEQIVYM